jgi:hypothetical protein
MSTENDVDTLSRVSVFRRKSRVELRFAAAVAITLLPPSADEMGRRGVIGGQAWPLTRILRYAYASSKTLVLKCFNIIAVVAQSVVECTLGQSSSRVGHG